MIRNMSYASIEVVCRAHCKGKGGTGNYPPLETGENLIIKNSVGALTHRFLSGHRVDSCPLLGWTLKAK